MMSHTVFVQCTAPMRCTSIRRRKSATSILAKLLSRRMPALLTRMSTRPHSFTAAATIASTAAKSVTDAPLAIARPPGSADLFGDRLRGRLHAALAVDAATEIVDNDLGTARRKH